MSENSYNEIWIVVIALAIFLFFISHVGVVASSSKTKIEVVGNSECLVKGNINSKEKKIYHLPECSKYDQVNINTDKGEKCFNSEEEAIKAGWEKSKNCP